MPMLPARPLANAIDSIVRAGGSSEREARLVADNLVEANLRGHDSHGVGMIPRYVEALREGGLRVNQSPRVTLDAGPLLALDGEQGYGQVIGHDAMAMAIERAGSHGACIMALGNAHHLGRIGQWSEQAVAAGLVSIHFVNVLSRPIVAPFGGSDARFGTNPISIGVPLAGREPFLLDFATSRIAQGKVRVAHNKGQRLPEGVLLDDHGAPTTDPSFGVIEPYGAITTFGEHKGYGLAMACELLGGALTGTMTQRVPNDGKRRVLNGMLAILIDPTRLGHGPAFAREAQGFVDWVLQAPPGPGTDTVLIAGDPERERRRKRLADGIDVDDTTWREILAAAEAVGLDPAGVTRTATAAA